MEIGRGVVIDRGARIVVRAGLKIGPDTYIGKNVTIIAFDEVTIGARALIAENVSLHSEDHGPPGNREAFTMAPIRIGEDAWLCAGVVVTKGSDIGDSATVGANAVVLGHVPAGALAVGIPARVKSSAL